jgi:hypothetical protein
MKRQREEEGSADEGEASEPKAMHVTMVFSAQVSQEASPWHSRLPPELKSEVRLLLDEIDMAMLLTVSVQDRLEAQDHLARHRDLSRYDHRKNPILTFVLKAGLTYFRHFHADHWLSQHIIAPICLENKLSKCALLAAAYGQEVWFVRSLERIEHYARLSKKDGGGSLFFLGAWRSVMILNALLAFDHVAWFSKYRWRIEEHGSGHSVQRQMEICFLLNASIAAGDDGKTLGKLLDVMPDLYRRLVPLDGVLCFDRPGTLSHVVSMAIAQPFSFKHLVFGVGGSFVHCRFPHGDMDEVVQYLIRRSIERDAQGCLLWALQRRSKGSLLIYDCLDNAIYWHAYRIVSFCLSLLLLQERGTWPSGFTDDTAAAHLDCSLEETGIGRLEGIIAALLKMPLPALGQLLQLRTTHELKFQAMLDRCDVKHMLWQLIHRKDWNEALPLFLDALAIDVPAHVFYSKIDPLACPDGVTPSDIEACEIRLQEYAAARGLARPSADIPRQAERRLCIIDCRRPSSSTPD